MKSRPAKSRHGRVLPWRNGSDSGPVQGGDRREPGAGSKARTIYRWNGSVGLTL